MRAVTATVRVVNVTQSSEGSGVLLKHAGPLVYILTANHVVNGAKQVEVATFTADSHPKAAAVYRKVEVIAQSAEADLAVLRLTNARRDAGVGCHLSGVSGAGRKGVRGAVGRLRRRPRPVCALEAVKATRRVRAGRRHHRPVLGNRNGPEERTLGRTLA